MAKLLTIPNLGTAEEEVTLIEWRVTQGEVVRRGQRLAVVETVKACFDLEADDEGAILRTLSDIGGVLERGQPYAVLGSPDEILSDEELEALLVGHASARSEPEALEEPAGRAAPAAPRAHDDRLGSPRGSVPAVPAARTLAKELGLDLAAITGSGPHGEVRVADVEAAASAGASAGAGPPGTVDPVFLEHIRSDPDAFARLASEFKVHLYRRHGARIGRDVWIGPGAYLLADRMEIGAEVRIAERCVIDCGTFSAGRLTQIGKGSTIRCREARLAENVFLVSDVEIGGGGQRDPGARIEIGGHCFIGEGVHLNPCRGIQIGEEVTLSRDARVMTHSFASSVLEGFPAVFAGVKIGSSSQIGIGSVIFPGVEVGEGAIVLSNSSVVTSVPAGKLAGGVPATVIKDARRKMDESQRRALAEQIILDFVDLVRAGGHRVDQLETASEGSLAFELQDGRGISLLVYAPMAPAEAQPVEGSRLPVVERVHVRLEGEPGEAGLATEIGLLAKKIRGGSGRLSDSLREFLRKRGVRLHPRTWTYRGGWI